MSPTQHTTTIDLEPLGLELCRYFQQQLETAHRHTIAILKKKHLFTRSTYKSAFKDTSHPLRDDLELSVYKYQSLYEILGKQLYQLWGKYSKELLAFRTIRAWINEAKPTMREYRNTIAHSFNTGTYYASNTEDMEPDEEALRNRAFSPGAYWDFLEAELPPLLADLEYAIRVFKEAEGVVKEKVYVKSEFVLEMEKEMQLWKICTDPVEIPDHWNESGVEWGCVEVAEEQDFSTPLLEESGECAPGCVPVEESGDDDEGFFEQSEPEFESEDIACSWTSLDTISTTWSFDKDLEDFAKISWQ